MGQKTHPIGFRIGIVKDWQAKWFAKKPADYRNLLKEDIAIRKSIMDRYPDAGISRIEIERSNETVATIYTSRPGIVIGRGGQRVDELKKLLEGIISGNARLNVQEIRQPELDAYLVGRSVADQLEKRVVYRRAMRLAISRTMQAGAKGVKILVSGRLGGADIARQGKMMEGRVPLHTLRADIDFGIAVAATEFGSIGVKVWIYKGDIIGDTAEEEEIEDTVGTIEVLVTANDGVDGEESKDISPGEVDNVTTEES